MKEYKSKTSCPLMTTDTSENLMKGLPSMPRSTQLISSQMNKVRKWAAPPYKLFLLFLIIKATMNTS